MENIEAIKGYSIRRDQLAYMGFWFIIPFCSFTSHTIVAVPPTMVLFVIGAFLLSAFTISSRRIANPSMLVLPLVLIGYVILSQTAILAPFTRYMGVIFAIGYFIVTTSYGEYLSLKGRESLTEKFINYSIALLIVECIWRYTHPDLSYQVFEGTGDTRWIYQYKMGGIMYADSNATGIHIIIILFFLFYRESKGLGAYKWAKIILIVLLLFTFSRAAWAGAVLGWIYFRYLQNKNLVFYVANFVVLSIVLVLVYKFFLEARIRDDLSYRSKFEIIIAVSDYLKHASLRELIFGVGFSNSLEVLGIYAHNFFMVFLVESGFLGLTLLLLFLVQVCVATRGLALIILVPFAITTLSSSITFIPYLYVTLALIYLDQKNNLRYAG